MPVRPLPPCLALGVALCAGAAPGWPQSPIPAPDIVGRIASVTGPVSFHPAGAAEWQVAIPNLPLPRGAALWTGPAGEAAIGVSGNRAVLGEQTEFALDRLDDRGLAATQGQGESYLHVRELPAGDTYTIQTPRGIVAVATVGRYEVVSGDAAHPTTVTVLDGAATVTGLPEAVEAGPNQTVTITGDGTAAPFAASVGPAVQDEFLRRMLAAERPPTSSAAPAIVRQMTGADALEAVGEWAESPAYGPVWYPPVAAGYVPYRQGRWAYVAPWGWTWVDAAPWGFAPTHYGRWALIEDRWGWVPGRDWAPGRPPVYAPALVGFVGGFAAGSLVGWAPLGPHQPYRPPYPVAPGTLEALNRPTGAVQVVNGPVFERGSITVVPARVLATSAAVAGAVQAVPARGGQTMQFRPAAAPTRSTIGATAALLRQVNPPGLSAPATHVAPGPAFRPALALAPRLPMTAPPMLTPPVTAPPMRPGIGHPGAVPVPHPSAGMARRPDPLAPMRDDLLNPRRGDLLAPRQGDLPTPRPAFAPHAPERHAPERQLPPRPAAERPTPRFETPRPMPVARPAPPQAPHPPPPAAPHERREHQPGG